IKEEKAPPPPTMVEEEVLEWGMEEEIFEETFVKKASRKVEKIRGTATHRCLRSEIREPPHGRDSNQDNLISETPILNCNCRSNTGSVIVNRKGYHRQLKPENTLLFIGDLVKRRSRDNCKRSNHKEGYAKWNNYRHDLKFEAHMWLDL
ncbi:hypothetical protein HAX54_038143, partial [Datura stramonium]|nr:hypothetical protein [Datura stramonium]